MAQQSSNSSNSVILILIAIFMGVVALITFFPSLAVVGCGGLLGGLGSAARVGAADVAGGIVTLLGIAGLAISIAMVVYAFGLVTRKPWAYMGAIVLHAVHIGLQLLTAVTVGLGTVQIIFIVLSGASIYYLLTNEETKAAFGRA